MFTRFRTLSRCHWFNAPLIKIPPSTDGALFLAALGGAYEFEEEQLRGRLIQAATQLRLSLQQPELQGGARRSGIRDKFVGAARFSDVRR